MFYVAPLALIALLGLAARRRRAEKPARAAPGRRDRRGAARSSSLPALHHDERGLRHLRAAPVVVGPGSRHSSRQPALGGTRRLGGSGGALPAPAAAVRARAARARRRVLRVRRRSSSRTAGTGSTSRRSARCGPASACSTRTGSTARSGPTPRSTTSGQGRRASTRSGRTSSSTGACAASTGSPARAPIRCRKSRLRAGPTATSSRAARSCMPSTFSPTARPTSLGLRSRAIRRWGSSSTA